MFYMSPNLIFLVYHSTALRSVRNNSSASRNQNIYIAKCQQNPTLWMSETFKKS